MTFAIQHDLNIQQTLQKLDLDWTVVKSPVVARPKGGALDGAEFQVPDLFALLRSDNGHAVGSCGSRYVPYHNGQMLDLLARAAKSADMKITSGICWHGGRQVSFTVQLDQFEAVKDDVVEQYCFTNLDHTGGGGVTVGGTNVRPICQNTWRMALREANQGGRNSARHTLSVGLKVEELVKRLVLVREIALEDQISTRILGQTKAGDSMAKEYFARVFKAIDAEPVIKSSADVKAIEGHAQWVERGAKATARWFANLSDERQRPARGTLWGAFNAITQWVDHERRGKNDEERMFSGLFGSGADIKDAAREQALAVVR